MSTSSKTLTVSGDIYTPCRFGLKSSQNGVVKSYFLTDEYEGCPDSEHTARFDYKLDEAGAPILTGVWTLPTLPKKAKGKRVLTDDPDASMYQEKWNQSYRFTDPETGATTIFALKNPEWTQETQDGSPIGRADSVAISAPIPRASQ